MKITRIETIRVDYFLFVKVHTDEGIVGLGESGTWAFLEASEAAVETFARFLVGQDPLRIEHLWQCMYRAYHFRGAAIMGAISAIDIALWDIAGKKLNVPAYQLLGGKCRDKARVYYHVQINKGGTANDIAAGCIAAKNKGFNAIGHLIPFPDEPRETIHEFTTQANKIARAADTIRTYREAVGNDVDLCVEIHRRLDPSEAILLANEIEQYRPMFFEDPIPPDNLDAMEYVAKNIRIPIATGERLHTIYEFEALLKRNAVQFIRPDVCIAGGLTHCKKISALAEAHNVMVVPHNPLSPVSTAACLQLAACIPNFSILEYPDDIPSHNKIVKNTITCENGFLIVSDAPGIGVELVDDAHIKFPYRPRKFQPRIYMDGSVINH